MVGLVAVAGFVVFNQKDKGPFYVGVTYCCSSVEEAKELIDKVKDYTNLFILLSGPFQSDVTAMEEIGDYAVASNLNYAISSGAHIDDKSKEWLKNGWLNSMKEKWGKQFSGIYYNDEPAGNMLDGMVTLDYPYDVTTSNTQKNPDGSIHINDNVYDENSGEIYSVQTVYSPDGSILVNGQDRIKGHDGHVIYYPDGTITAYARSENKFYTSENLTECPLSISTYEQVLKRNPIKNNDEAANVFINRNKDFFEDINKKQLNKEQITVFTADYGLYWWDYQSGMMWCLLSLLGIIRWLRR
ncbi:MAG: hypothetical protein LBE76_01170 [Nitrososphaerota archaeon]|jgi:hypothetical protein|nr:hypothetical protein [Nitrososphaerota archaeon]